MDLARSAQVTVKRVSVQSTTLDDVFLHYTGQRSARCGSPGGKLDISHLYLIRFAGLSGTRRRIDMKFYRIWALIERDMRKFFRSPALMMASMVLPLVQLIVLGYAFGGKIKRRHPRLRRSRIIPSNLAACKRCLLASQPGPQTFRVVDYDSLPRAVDDLRAGFVSGVVDIPHDFSRRYYQHDRPRIAFTEDNTDQFMASALLERIQQMVDAMNTPDVAPRLDSQVQLDVVEVYPYIEYAKYLLAGSTAMAIFIVAMIGGGITFIDDKSRGLHEGYLLTPIHKSELVLRPDRRGRVQGPDGGHGSHDYWRSDRGHSSALGSGAPFLSDSGRSGRVDCHD